MTQLHLLSVTELLLFYITCIRSILEYGSPVFHRALPSYPSENQERLQRRSMKFIYPELPYVKALELSGVLTPYDRREAIAAKLFDEIHANQSHSLHKLLPSKCQPSYSLREQRTFLRPKRKTERCKNSFLLSHVLVLLRKPGNSIHKKKQRVKSPILFTSKSRLLLVSVNTVYCIVLINKLQ